MEHEERLPFEVSLKGVLFKRLVFSCSLPVAIAKKLAYQNDKMARCAVSTDRHYHINAAVVYYLYLLNQGKSTRFYKNARRGLLDLIKWQSPSSRLINLCYVLLCEDKEFMDFHESHCVLGGVSCSIL